MERGFSFSRPLDRSNIVYHYASIDTFMAILGNKTLRMTNIAKSNDRSEISCALELIAEATHGYLAKHMRRSDDNESLAIIVENFDAEDFFGNILSESNLVYYAVCFSREPDLLSQWRGYANDGNGVAIGFYERVFDGFWGAKDPSLKYAHIIYDVDRLKKRVEDFISRGFSENEKAGKTATADYANVLSDLLSWATYQSVFFKNPAFEEERETRLVFYPFGNIRSLRRTRATWAVWGQGDERNDRYYDRMAEFFDYTDESHPHGNLTFSKPSFLVRGNKLVSYLDCSFAKVSREFLAEVVLGPKTDLDDAELRLFLLANGYDIDKVSIVNSKAPYM